MKEIDIELVKKIVIEAGELFRNREAASHTKTKGVADFVTEVDFAVQKFVSGKLSELYPEIQFMGEEKDNSDIDRNGLVWILDPVDGTTNLIHDYHASVVSLALMEKEEIILGIVYNPYMNEFFCAKKGAGAFLNGERIHVSEAERMDQCLIALGTSPYYKELAKQNFEMFCQIFVDAQDVRRSGSAALDLAYVASGRIDGYFERSLKIWDYAAGMLLVREAGGKILDYQGKDSGTANIADIVSGNTAIAPILVENYLNK